MESFFTIQGEGANTGKPAWFIRLAGCDVGCSWCDVKESWETEGFPVLTIDKITEMAVKSGAKNVVVTGGEPAMYPLEPLSKALKNAGLSTWLETSGAHPISGNWDWICLSPKKFKTALTANFSLAHELKVVVTNKTDFAWAERLRSKVPDNCSLFLQPEWQKREKIIPTIVDYVKANPEWVLSLQTHKYIGVP